MYNTRQNMGNFYSDPNVRKKFRKLGDHYNKYYQSICIEAIFLTIMLVEFFLNLMSSDINITPGRYTGLFVLILYTIFGLNKSKYRLKVYSDYKKIGEKFRILSLESAGKTLLIRGKMNILTYLTFLGMNSANIIYILQNPHGVTIYSYEKFVSKLTVVLIFILIMLCISLIIGIIAYNKVNQWLYEYTSFAGQNQNTRDLKNGFYTIKGAKCFSFIPFVVLAYILGIKKISLAFTNEFSKEFDFKKQSGSYSISQSPQQTSMSFERNPSDLAPKTTMSDQKSYGYCPKCGATVEKGLMKFCAECGEDLSNLFD